MLKLTEKTIYECGACGNSGDLNNVEFEVIEVVGGKDLLCKICNDNACTDTVENHNRARGEI